MYQIKLEEKIIKLKKKNTDIENNEEIKDLTIKVKRCEEIFKKLKNFTFKNKIMKEAAILFYES